LSYSLSETYVHFNGMKNALFVIRLVWNYVHTNGLYTLMVVHTNGTLLTLQSIRVGFGFGLLYIITDCTL